MNTQSYITGNEIITLGFNKNDQEMQTTYPSEKFKDEECDPSQKYTRLGQIALVASSLFLNSSGVSVTAQSSLGTLHTTSPSSHSHLEKTVSKRNVRVGVVNQTVISKQFDTKTERHITELSKTENEGINRVTLFTNRPADSENVSHSDIKKEDLNMNNQLVLQRNKVEKAGIVTGITLTLASLSIPIFTSIPLTAMLPGATMFLSLSGLMLLRKKLRGTERV
ncbi:hypothetical protein FA950_20765 [Bacillus thuringiensis]|uniref:hypothetical protein n=1 Tax=Bacillus thuringiensis TaxID=1428 RepID=UPI0010AC7A19|nr:hypothetical protein [Bacillus thuringiensis]TKA02504.1 hypothetical protein FA950_20765 [Bacillus thuringiensis]